VTGKEIANFQPFMRELCATLGLPDAPPETGAPERDAYAFERSVTFTHGDDSTSPGRIDLYRRGAFVCEGKRVKAGAQTRAFDDALLRARSQAEAYARALPASEGRPPFLLVVDVGNLIEVYAEFTRTGATYTPFPDPRSHRIGLADLARPDIQDRLRAIWLDPLSLDPTRASARVTRAIAKRQQAQHPDLTLTGMYNVLDKLRAGEALSAKEKDIHQKGLVSVLKTLHDEIDRAVLEAYGWADLVPLMEIVNGNAVCDRAEDSASDPTLAQPGRSGLQAVIPMTRDGAYVARA
jgi:hypothetical protein